MWACGCGRPRVHCGRVRCVPQAQEAEAARATGEHRVQELTYANRKLAAELEAAQSAAKAASDRDRRSLRSLREGLAEVGRAAGAARACCGWQRLLLVCGRLRALAHVAC